MLRSQRDAEVVVRFRIVGIEFDCMTEKAFRADGTTVGLLPQEPRLTAGATVRGCVEEAVAGTRSSSARVTSTGPS